MAEPLEIVPTISKLIQLIEEQYNAIRELNGRTDGNCTCITLILEQIHGHIISGQMKLASHDLSSFELNVYRICNLIDCLKIRLCIYIVPDELYQM